MLVAQKSGKYSTSEMLIDDPFQSLGGEEQESIILNESEYRAEAAAARQKKQKTTQEVPQAKPNNNK